MKKEGDFSKELKFIEDYHINNPMLSRLLGIKNCTFFEKKKGQRGARFSDDQKQKISQFLKKMREDLESLL